MTRVGIVAGIYRYPVKSMRGESVTEAVLTERGIAGDRAYALLDTETGRIASAHHPRIWGGLLHCLACWDGDRVTVTLPDGRRLQVGPELESSLSDLTGRPVRFITQAAENSEYDFQIADVPGHAPQAFIDRALASATRADSRVGRLRLAMNAPAGTLVDVAPLHVITTGSLTALGRGGGDPDVRRFRPNILIDNGNEPRYTEAEFSNQRLTIASTAVDLTMPTMRCIVPTLGQAGVQRHTETLAAIARDNLLHVGPGNWACLGHYASVTSEGSLHVGDTADIGPEIPRAIRAGATVRRVT